MNDQSPLVQLSLLVAQRRKELNIKQEDLSELTGISLRTLRDIEHASGNPSLETITKVMEVLGIDLVFKLRK